jgi:CPA1 family monovalent cation:H+ antiporter
MAATAGIIILYSVAMVVAIVSRRLRVPYTAALLLAGVALGSTHVAALPHLTRELLFAVFLPGLLFEAAYHLEVRELRENAWTIGALAVPGVVVAIGLTALLLHVGAVLVGRPGALDWQTALLFGSAIAATDPVAVTALFREVSAPRRLLVLVESESLLNDGTSIVFLTLMLAYFSGESPTALSLGIDFVRIAGGGALLGMAVGWGVSHIRTQLDDSAIEITLTTIAAYGSFVLAEQLHCSGVVATVAAGVVCGHAGRHHPMTAGTRASVDGFWAWLAFALNSAVFLLLGAEISPAVIGSEWRLMQLAALAALAARAVVVGATGAALGATHERMPAGWLAVLTWGGLRGALSLVLALSLPADAGRRPLIVAMTAATVALSLVGQGATMPWLLRKLRVVGAPSSAAPGEMSR